jgi:HSP20 family molecular chaperone IbpA
LPAEVDPASSRAVLSGGLLGIRMLKKFPAQQ